MLGVSTYFVLSGRVDDVLPPVVLAAAGVTGSAWLIVIGFVGHGLKDLWQHRSHFVANTRWWPPFCMTIDFVAAAIIAVAIVGGAVIPPLTGHMAYVFSLRTALIVPAICHVGILAYGIYARRPAAAAAAA